MEVITTSEAVRQFRMHPATVLRLILTQRVTASKDANGKWLIRRSDLERWNRQRVRGGKDDCFVLAPPKPQP